MTNVFLFASRLRPPFRAGLCLCALWMAACTVDPPGGDTPPAADAGVVELAAPRPTAPSATPFTSVAVRGTATGASRVVVKNEETQLSTVGALLPGGSFCVDTKLSAATTSKLSVFSVAENGAISPPATLDVAQDDGASPPSDPTCVEENTCGDAEICGNNIDDDCNGFRDSCDSECNGCQDDNLEPNDVPFSVPNLSEGTYDLKLCPCREDWFGFVVGASQRIRVTANFVHDDIDIDLELYKAANAESRGSPEQTASTANDSETIDFTTVEAGAYYVRAYSFRVDDSGSYSLTID